MVYAAQAFFGEYLIRAFCEGPVGEEHKFYGFSELCFAFVVDHLDNLV